MDSIQYSARTPHRTVVTDGERLGETGTFEDLLAASGVSAVHWRSQSDGRDQASIAGTDWARRRIHGW